MATGYKRRCTGLAQSTVLGTSCSVLVVCLAISGLAVGSNSVEGRSQVARPRGGPRTSRACRNAVCQTGKARIAEAPRSGWLMPFVVHCLIISRVHCHASAHRSPVFCSPSSDSQWLGQGSDVGGTVDPHQRLTYNVRRTGGGSATLEQRGSPPPVAAEGL